MPHDKTDRSDARALRRRAQKRLPAGHGSPISGEPQMAPETQRLVCELQVHQIELELQNEEVQRARTEAEEALSRYTDLYELAPVGYLTLGRGGEIRQINLTGARLLGLERARLVRRRLGPLLVAESRPIFDAFLVSMCTHRTKAACEVVLHAQSESTLALELTGAAVDGSDECRVVVTDVTERHRATHEREGLQSQLAHAQKMEAVGTLAGGIAHDFNNILGGILGTLSLLDHEGGEAGPHHSDFQEMMAMVGRGVDLTRQLLGFARRGKYDVRPLDLARVVEETSTMFGRTRSDITIQIEAAPRLPAVLMDHAQLEQVLLNLLVNAGQAMPEGGQVRLCASSVELSPANVAPHAVAPGRFVKLTITDTGVGIDPTTQARIFEPFFTTKRPGQGTGLGLASVYGIIKNHAGFITLESALGRGTTFSLFLPATPLATDEAEAPPVAIQRGSGTILVVDDEKMIVDVVARVLKSIGYDVLTASGGRQAVELMRTHREKISLVILDMVMPDMNGRQTYDAMQEIAPGTKVLISTGYSINGQAQEILARGCNDFLQKPFDAASLSAKVREILSRPPVRVTVELTHNAVHSD